MGGEVKGERGWLCFVIVAFPGHVHLYLEEIHDRLQFRLLCPGLETAKEKWHLAVSTASACRCQSLCEN